VEGGPSTAAAATGAIFEEDDSGGNLPGILADSDKAGHDSAPITGPISTTTPFKGCLFHAGLLEPPALPPSPPSEAIVLKFFSTGAGRGEDTTTAFGESSDGGGWSAVVREEEEDDDDEGSDWWIPVGDCDCVSVSPPEPPRTTWAHGEGRVFRMKLGLLVSEDGGAGDGTFVGEWLFWVVTIDW